MQIIQSNFHSLMSLLHQSICFGPNLVNKLGRDPERSLLTLSTLLLRLKASQPHRAPPASPKPTYPPTAGLLKDCTTSVTPGTTFEIFNIL